MYYYSIDELIEEVNRVALLPNTEVLRSPCIGHVQTVYRKVGSDKVKIPAVAYFTVTNGTVELPKTVIKVVDCALGTFDLNDTDDDGTFADYDAIPHRQDGNKLRLNNNYNGQTVSVSYWSLPVDENGVILIDDRIYDAVKAFCKGEELLIKSSNVKQERATLNPSLIYKREAAQLIDESRAELNRMTVDDWRKLVADLHGYNERYCLPKNFNIYYVAEKLPYYGKNN